MISYSGFNGFGQWPSEDYLINNFTPLDLQTYGSNNESIDVTDFHIGWAYNVININSKFIINGLVESSPNSSETLITPIGTTFTNCSCSEKYILFYNMTNKSVWKYCLSNEVEKKWSLLPNFINAERLDSESPLVNDEHVQKIVCGTMVNIALSSEGRLFNIPSEISTAHIIGKIIDISCGHEHGIALTDQGNVYSWGGGSRCQLGHGSTESLSTPEQIQGLAGIKIVKISSGGWHSCAISITGDLYTWGWNDRGQLGIYSDDVTLESKELKNTSCDGLTSKVNDDSKDMSDLCPNIKLLDRGFPTKAVDDIRIEDSIKRKKFEGKTVNGRDFTPLSNYAIPMLIDIYDHESNIVNLNITDVACGSKHTLIKLENASVWGSGCNKYGQLGFNTDSTQEVCSFKRLDINAKGDKIYCGTWASIVKEL